MNTTSSVVICTRNRLQDITTCLHSLKEQTVQPNELIIVDSSDNKLVDNPAFTQLCNQQEFPQTNIVYKHTAPGLPLQRNVGISLASSDITYFFDDDVILEKNYLETMNVTFVNNPHYHGGMGAVTNLSSQRLFESRISYAQFMAQRLIRTIFLLQRDYASGAFTISGMPTHTYGTKQFKEVEVLGGCCMAYKTTVFKKHLFDESLKRYAFMEDCDFSCRVSRDGPLFFNPAAKLKHMNSPLNRDAIVDNRAMYIENYSYLFFKNFYQKNRLKIIAYWWSVLGLFIEATIRGQWAYLKGYVLGLRRFFSHAS